MQDLSSFMSQPSVSTQLLPISSVPDSLFRKSCSSSLDSKSLFISTQEEEDKEEGGSCRSIPFTPTLGNSEFLKLASMALNLGSGSSLLEDANDEGMRNFGTEAPDAGFSLDLLSQKTDYQVRCEYIDRLRYLKVIKDEHRKPHQTLTIFDWDDTILPTSYLLYIGSEKMTSDVEAKLQALDQQVAKLLTKASKIGMTYIVTNGMEGWVEKSSKMHLPLTYQTIHQRRITVISARARYQEEYPNEPRKWKEETFSDIGNSLDTQIVTNIICLGDSDCEIDAAVNLSKKFKQAMLKTVKFKQCPSALELTKQINVVLEKFDQIYTTLKTLSIKLEKKN